MRRIATRVIAAVAFAALGTGFVRMPTAAATVQALAMPDGFTIDPEGQSKRMTIAPDGTIYAMINPIGATSVRALRWGPQSARELFVPVPQPGDDQPPSAPNAEAIAPASEGTFVSIGRTHDGAFIGTEITTNLWTAGHATSWQPPACVDASGGSLVYAADGHAIALTIDPSANSTGIDLDDPSSVASNLPQAYIIDADHCTPLGAAVVTALRGISAVGYLGYLDGKRAPVEINLMVQQMRATRWLAGRAQPLGPGVPFATTATGIVAGASALPGHAAEWVTGNFFGPAGTYRFAIPHAVMWTSGGRRVFLLHDDARSVAWDINANETIVGMTQDAHGRHYAFRRNADGHVDRLDDLPHPSNWRFESAYAVDAHGAIAGIGTRDGVATAFLWRPD